MRVMHKHLEVRLRRIDEEARIEQEAQLPFSSYAIDIFREWALNKGVPFSYAPFFINRLGSEHYTPRVMKGQLTRIYNKAIRNGTTFSP